MGNVNSDKDRTRAMLLLPSTTPGWPQAWLEMCGLESTQPVFERHVREVNKLYREGNEGGKWPPGMACEQTHDDCIVVPQPEIPKNDEQNDERQVKVPRGKVAVEEHGKGGGLGTKPGSWMTKDNQVKANMVEEDEFSLWKGCCERCDGFWDT